MLSPSTTQKNSQWRSELKSAIRSPRPLREYLGLPDEVILRAERDVDSGFQFLVPWSFARRMTIGRMDDPLLLQVWPTDHSRPHGDLGKADFVDDPVGDRKVIVADGLLHKYRGRVLLVTTGACAVHCRYCFRQNFPYRGLPHSIEAWAPAIDYIRNDSSIHEVILSGGDPLTIVDSVLSDLVAALEEIPHITRLRLHTRLPIVIPSRVNSEFLQWFGESRLSKWLVVHTNHVNEINDEVASAIQLVKSADCMVLNQSVLLRGINDTAESQLALCERLVDIGVLPYYLHGLDRVKGSEHFEIAESTGKHIIEHLRRSLPGYAVPKYVCEIAGEPSKTPID